MPIVFSLPLITWNLLKGEVCFQFIISSSQASVPHFAIMPSLTPHWLDLRHENDLHETLLILSKEEGEYSMQKAQERLAFMFNLNLPRKEKISMPRWGLEGLCWAEAKQGDMWFLYKMIHSLTWFGVSRYISLNTPNWCISWRWKYEQKKERGINSGSQICHYLILHSYYKWLLIVHTD